MHVGTLILYNYIVCALAINLVMHYKSSSSSLTVSDFSNYSLPLKTLYGYQNKISLTEKNGGGGLDIHIHDGFTLGKFNFCDNI